MLLKDSLPPVSEKPVDLTAVLAASPPEPSEILYSTINAVEDGNEPPPEGYYAFVEAPNAEPPRVRPPPYTFTPVDCKEDLNRTPHGSMFNICGDLNKGTIPRNPMGQNVLGTPYPFELIRNMTLKYLSRTLPILKADETLPKVAQLQEDIISQNAARILKTGFSHENKGSVIVVHIVISIILTKTEQSFS
ncbi:unnamed protein product [Ceutorhynchus assimilis]|uniref:Uncharacterized protein n=1 Tax=Ceutorhynchus assimilis TaxID=467358 RepID=A0A9N9QDR4_9CUCU|nr:unnamed protein product [Ceutorhynchus assimilis]